MGSWRLGVFFFAVRSMIGAEMDPPEWEGLSWKPGGPVEVGASRWRAELVMAGTPPKRMTIEGLEHMQASDIEQDLTHEVAVARVRQAI